MKKDTVVSLKKPMEESDPLSSLLREGARASLHGAVEAELATYLSEWDGETLWRTYFMLTDCEAVFRSLKSELGLRPVYHHKPLRAEGHLFITVIAYQFGAGHPHPPAARRRARQLDHTTRYPRSTTTHHRDLPTHRWSYPARAQSDPCRAAPTGALRCAGD